MQVIPDANGDCYPHVRDSDYSLPTWLCSIANIGFGQYFDLTNHDEADILDLIRFTRLEIANHDRVLMAQVYNLCNQMT